MPKLIRLLPLVLIFASPAYAERAPADCGERPDRETARCLFDVARETPELTDVVLGRLGGLIERAPKAGWPLLYRGRLTQWTAEGEESIRRAADIFSAEGSVSGEISARAYLVKLRGFRRDLSSSFSELQRLQQLAELSPLDEDRALVDIAEAHYRMLSGVDLREAYARLRDALEAFEQAPAGYYLEQKECLRALLQVTADLGMNWEVKGWATAADELARSLGTPRDRAATSFDLVLASLRSELPSESGRQELITRFRDTISMAERADYAWIEASSHLHLAELTEGPEAAEHLELYRQSAADLGDPDLEKAYLLTLATHLLDEDPEQAVRIVSETYSTGWGPWTPLQGWADRMRVLWATQPPELAVEASSTTLSAIEAFRRNQVGNSSDRLLSASADAYYWVSGRLLRDQPSPDGLRQSFAVIERLRSQALREALEAPNLSIEVPPEELARHNQEMGQLQTAYTDVYRGLLDPRLAEQGRRDLLDTLTDLERRESNLQRDMAATWDRPALEPPRADLMERAQRALAEDEALFSYQLGLWEGWDRRFLGGSWLTVLTRSGVNVYPLRADRAVLENQLGVLLGLDDPEVPEALALLYGELLDPALRELPAAVRKLILVPDGALHLLPFSLLREAVGAAPLVERYELQVVPSATLWLHWRGIADEAVSESRQALVLANPAMPSSGSQATTRSWAFDSATALGPLPYAEREGRKVLRRVGGQGRLESGAEASELLLKAEDLSRFSIIHFASHAVVNPLNPERSAVMLAAGSDDEDGFLRPPEITQLEGLDGKLVVLSACETAAGSVLRGEGVLSLGRAFFEAGAQAVVASLWRLDDRLATRFFDDFYQQLRKGVTVSRALAETQREWSRQGRPAAIWAGIVLLGNGDLVPIPGGVPTSPLKPIALGAAALALILLTVLALRHRSTKTGSGAALRRN